jgi:D-glycero-alpha-D-manno-heptose 1-phosphate guanylyltransferase
MEAIILAGGFGTRLRTIVPDMPKPMALVAGSPFLEILLNTLAQKGFDRVVLSVGYMADKIISHFGEKYAGINLAYEVESTPLGTGGAIRQALKKCHADHVFILNGDTYLDIESTDMEDLWQRNHNPMIVARKVSDSSRYGLLSTDDDRIVAFSSSGHTGPGLINAGCYVFPKHIFDGYRYDKVFSLEADWLPYAITQQRFDVFITQGLFVDIGTPEDYLLAQKILGAAK